MRCRTAEVSTRRLELCRRFRAAGRIAGAVGMGPGASELAAVDDEIFVANRASFEPAFEDLPRAGGITRLGRKRSAGDMRRHAVMRHGPPRVILGRGLR